MLTTCCSRRIQAPAQELWVLVSDPHHLPRWWPRVERVEGVEGGAFTQVLKTAKGKAVRADFTVTETDEAAGRLTWVQQLAGSPFARVLASAETQLELAAEGESTLVTIELRQTLAGVLPHLGGHMVSRAARATLEQALDGLQRIGTAADG